MGSAHKFLTKKKSPIDTESLNFAINLKAETERSAEIWLLNEFFKPGIRRSVREVLFLIVRKKLIS